MSMSTYRVNEIVIRTGMVGGLVAGCLGIVQFGLAPLVSDRLDAGALRDVVSDASMLASFATFFLVGCLVQRWTGSVEAAARAGFVAAIITCLLSSLAVAVPGAVLPSAYVQETTQTAPGIGGSSSAGTSVLVTLATLVVLAAAGFGLAMAGALAGRPRTANHRVPRYR